MDIWLKSAVDGLQQMEKRLLTEALFKRLDEIRIALDEQTMISVRAGFQHLLDGINSDVKAIKQDEFRMARQEFTRLVAFNSAGSTQGIENSWLIGFGHLGNLLYFSLRRDKRNALLQVYECTKESPLIGLLLFSSEFFSEDYLTKITELIAKQRSLQDKYDAATSTNVRRRIGNGTKSALRLTAGLFVAVTAGAVVGAVTGGWGALPAALVSGGKTIEAMGGLLDEASLQDTGSLELAIRRGTEELDTSLTKLVKECETRQVILRRFSLADLLEADADSLALPSRARKTVGKRATKSPA